MTKTTAIKTKATKLAKAERNSHRHQLHVHLICISLSVILGITISYCTAQIFIHIAAFVVPGIPAAIQEVLDKVIYGEMTKEG